MEIQIVREYLEALKEDTELDYLFPMLLNAMGFQIITTPKEYKGLSQYGKDIIAVGKDNDGIKKRFYFELKAGRDKDITSKTFTKDDGIRMSIIEAKDHTFNDSSLPQFNNLPIKIVIVHSGILHPNVRDTFEGFINREFPPNNNLDFERWDIEKISLLFTEHLFGPYLFVDKEIAGAFKRILAYYDVSEQITTEFGNLVKRLITRISGNKIKPNRKLPIKIIRFFETLKLIGLVIYQLSKESNNLEPIKACLSFLVLKVWYWIIAHKLEENKKIIQRFEQIQNIHFQLLKEYFDKLLPVAQIKNGLFSEHGGRFEQIGYPLRSMEFLKYLHYYYMIVNLKLPSKNLPNSKKQIQTINTLVNNNDGTFRPLFDNHSVTIHLTLKFFIKSGQIENAKVYLINTITHLAMAWQNSKRLPDGNNSLESLVRLYATGKKSIYYEDSGSMLIGMLFEYMAVLGLEEEYLKFKDVFKHEDIYKEIDLSSFIPFSEKQLKEYLPDELESFENIFFKRGIYYEGYQSEIYLNDEFESFVIKTKDKNEYQPIEYRTEKVGFGHLIDLAHIFYSTPYFPNDWRKLIN